MGLGETEFVAFGAEPIQGEIGHLRDDGHERFAPEEILEPCVAIVETVVVLDDHDADLAPFEGQYFLNLDVASVFEF